jgi:hypothetical protein
MPHQRIPGVGVGNGRVTFHELKLKMLDGEAWILKPLSDIPAAPSSPANDTKPAANEALPSPGEAKAPLRTWTDSTGQRHIEAAFVGQVDGQVRLRRPDGKEVNLALEKLSPADQEWVRRQATQ